jgi:hypothetical protein
METLITLGVCGAAIFAVACMVSLVALAAARWPRYVKRPLAGLWEVVLVLLSLPLMIFVWLTHWADNSHVRHAVVLVGFIALLIALNAIFDR